MNIMPIATSYEIIFDKAGSATLQNHTGDVALHYIDMAQLAADVHQLDTGENPAFWDGVDPDLHISTDEYRKAAPSGGLLALQLDPEYRHNWPDPENHGWNNIRLFLTAFAAA